MDRGHALQESGKYVYSVSSTLYFRIFIVYGNSEKTRYNIVRWNLITPTTNVPEFYHDDWYLIRSKDKANRL